ncbi:MAG TPA: XdhC/CoxI family protein [Chloroflexota bacterium]
MQAIARGIVAALEARRQALTATVVSRSRGLPCEPGAKVLVVEGEVRAGGLGWDRLQRRVLADAPAVLAKGEPQVLTYTFEAGEGDDVPRSGTVEVFVEVYSPPPTLLIVGAGHIAVPLAQVGKLMDFEVVVVDDRASFANRERFPTADEIVVGDYEQVLDGFPVGPQTYIVLVTRAHTWDVVSLRRVIRRPAAYIGMIGSRRRVFAVFKLLHDEGVPLEDIARVHAPIGLDIETETPAEIAISIAAEIIKVRRGGGAPSLSDHVRERYLRALQKGERDIA